MIPILILLTSTATSVEPGGAKLPITSNEPSEVHPSEVHVLRTFVRGQLRLVYDNHVSRPTRIRLPSPGEGDVFMESGTTRGYSVIRDFGGPPEELSWIEFFEITGDRAEAERRSRNAALTYTAMIGGPVLIAAGVPTAIIVDDPIGVRYGAFAAIGVGLVSVILGFVLSDGPPAHDEVAKTIKRYNAALP